MSCRVRESSRVRRHGLTAGRVLWLLTLWAACGSAVGGCKADKADAAAPQSSSKAVATSVDSANVGAPFPARFPAVRRLVAVGDVHGDLMATRKALRLAGLIDSADSWTGADTVLVQTGDILDRGDGERAIIALFEGLARQAQAAGGQVHVLNGNHELMNAAGDFRYVTPGGFADFAGAPGLDLQDPAVQRKPVHERPRWAAFRPGGPYARKLASYPVVLVVGDSVFVHGGLLPSHVKYGLERINQEVRDWLLGGSLRGRRLMARRDSPVWVREQGAEPSEQDCQRLAQTLQSIGAARLVVGHTVHEDGIDAACGEQVWRIDVGLAASYGGRIEVLEIADGRPRVLR